MDINTRLHQAQALQRQKKYPEAIAIYEQILKEDPNERTALLLYGSASYTLGEYDQAIDLLKKCLIIDARQPLALLKLGQAFIKTKAYDHAEAPLLEVTQIAPQLADGYFHLARLRKLQENFEDAAKLYEMALKLKPDYPAALNNLGNVYQLEGEEDKAIATYEKLIKLQPNLAMAHCNLASLWKTKGKFEKARQGYIFSLQLDPNLQLAHFNLGNLAAEKHNQEEAETYFRKAIKVKPDYAEAFMALSQCLDNQSRPFEALETLNRAFELEPDYETQVKYRRGILSLKSASWSGYDQMKSNLLAAVADYVQQEEPKESLATYDINYFSDDMSLHQKMAKIQARQIGKAVSKYKGYETFSYEKTGNRRIRLAYLSPDLRLHAVGRIMRSFFKYHDRSQFEVFAYTLLATGDFIENEIKESCDHFVDLSKMEDMEAAERINQDGIDILIDLAVYTKHAKPTIMALKPAKVQMTFVGYPGTSGAEYIDYIIADEVILPRDSTKYYTEKPLYVPCAWMAPEVDIQQGLVTRKSLGLPDDAFVFAALNSVYKINPEVFDVWMGILKAVPHSILLLTHMQDRIIQNLRDEAEKRGVEKDRLYFGEFLKEPEYMARFGVCDLYLDTFSYTAGSSGIFALRGGLPVLTLRGKSNARRMSASIVTNAGLPELVCDTEESYQNKAIELANDTEALNSLKTKLRQNRNSERLFDNQRIVKDLEEQFLKLFH